MGYWSGWFRGLKVLLGLILINVVITFGVYATRVFMERKSPHEQYKPPECPEIKDRIDPLLYKLMCEVDE